MSWYYFGETAVTGHHVKMMLRENDVNIFLFNLDWHFRSILNEAITLNFNMAMATIARLNAMIFQLQKKKQQQQWFGGAFRNAQPFSTHFYWSDE